MPFLSVPVFSGNILVPRDVSLCPEGEGEGLSAWEYFVSQIAAVGVYPFIVVDSLWHPTRGTRQDPEGEGETEGESCELNQGGLATLGIDPEDIESGVLILLKQYAGSGRLMMHEIGHNIGLDHVFTEDKNLMWPTGSTSPGGPEDIAKSVSEKHRVVNQAQVFTEELGKMPFATVIAP